MAQRKRIVRKKAERQDLHSYLQKREVWIGLVTVVLVLLGVFSASRSRQQQEVISPTPTEVGMTPSATSEATATQAFETITPIATVSPVLRGKTTAPVKPSVKKLADTFGEYEVIALNGDNFWKVSKRTCGTGIYYLSIKEQNGYNDRALQPGDALIVYCTY